LIASALITKLPPVSRGQPAAKCGDGIGISCTRDIPSKMYDTPISPATIFPQFLPVREFGVGAQIYAT